MPNEFGFTAGKYQGVAARSDCAWGHGLKVSLLGEDGRTLNVVLFRCHPEFPNYDVLQAMGTDQLIELATNQLRTGELDQSLEQCRPVGLQLYVSFRLEP